MQAGMLGKNEALRQVWDGPLKDLVIKLNGENGPEVLAELNKFNRQKPCWVSQRRQVEVAEPQSIMPNLRATALTLADWLKAREELHKLFTGETVVLRDIFVFTEEELSSTTLMPAFRPAGATNRMAILWQKKMGVDVYEEAAVMGYKNSQGLRRHTLYLVNRSPRPDENTLGDNAKSPDALIQVPDKLWLGLFGWCDADTLHSAITEEHLDPATWTWFPKDRLPGDFKVAYGNWCLGQAKLSWNYAGVCHPLYGARSAKEVPLKM